MIRLPKMNAKLSTDEQLGLQPYRCVAYEISYCLACKII